MNPELVLSTTYQCPRCHFALEADSGGPPTWLRCAQCGRASQTPEVVRRIPTPGGMDQAHAILLESAEAQESAGLYRPRPMAARPAADPPRSSTPRLILGVGFFLSILFFVFSLLGGDVFRAAIFGAGAAVSLVLLSRPGRAREVE